MTYEYKVVNELERYFEFLARAIVRYLCIEELNLETFQEDFDLGRSNNFVSVADRIRSRYLRAPNLMPTSHRSVEALQPSKFISR